MRRRRPRSSTEARPGACASRSPRRSRGLAATLAHHRGAHRPSRVDVIASSRSPLTSDMRRGCSSCAQPMHRSRGAGRESSGRDAPNVVGVSIVSGRDGADAPHAATRIRTWRSLFVLSSVVGRLSSLGVVRRGDVRAAVHAMWNASAPRRRPARFPGCREAASERRWSGNAVPSAPVVARWPRSRPDHQFQIVLASVSPWRDGDRWSGAPARRATKACGLEYRPSRRRRRDAPYRLRLSARRPSQRVHDGERVAAGVVAVGDPGPDRRRLPRRVGIRPTDPFFGFLRARVSASSRVSDWPRRRRDRLAPIGRALQQAILARLVPRRPLVASAAASPLRRARRHPPELRSPGTFPGPCTPSSVRQCRARARPSLALLEIDDASRLGTSRPATPCPLASPAEHPAPRARTGPRPAVRRWRARVQRHGRTGALSDAARRQRAADARPAWPAARSRARGPRRRCGDGPTTSSRDAHDVERRSDLVASVTAMDGGDAPGASRPRSARARPAGALRRGSEMGRVRYDRGSSTSIRYVRRGDGGPSRDGDRPGEAATERRGRRDRLPARRRSAAALGRAVSAVRMCGGVVVRWCRRVGGARRLGVPCALRTTTTTSPRDRAVHLRAR